MLDLLLEMARTNPHVSVQDADRVKEAVEALKSAGVVTKREYGIEPALGRRSEQVPVVSFRGLGG